MTPLLLLLLLIAPAAHGQTLIDAAGAAAIQGTLQGASTPGYTNLLRSVEGRIPAPGAGSGSDSFGMLSAPGARGSQAGRGSALQESEGLFVVNGRVIRLCPSGLPCIGQVRRAMGLP